MSKIALNFNLSNRDLICLVLSRKFKLIRANMQNIYLSLYSFIMLITLFIVTLDQKQLDQHFGYSVLLCLWTISIAPELVRTLDYDYKAGFLEQFLLTGKSMELILLAHLLAYYLLYCAILTVSLLCGCILLNIPFTLSLFCTFAMFTLILSLIMMLGNCLAIDSSYNHTLTIALLTLSLPSLIITKYSIDNVSLLLVLSAIAFILLPFCIFCSVVAIKSALED